MTFFECLMVVMMFFLLKGIGYCPEPWVLLGGALLVYVITNILGGVIEGAGKGFKRALKEWEKNDTL